MKLPNVDHGVSIYLVYITFCLIVKLKYLHDIINWLYVDKTDGINSKQYNIDNSYLNSYNNPRW